MGWLVGWIVFVCLLACLFVLGDWLVGFIWRGFGVFLHDFHLGLTVCLGLVFVFRWLGTGFLAVFLFVGFLRETFRKQSCSQREASNFYTVKLQLLCKHTTIGMEARSSDLLFVIYAQFDDYQLWIISTLIKRWLHSLKWHWYSKRFLSKKTAAKGHGGWQWARPPLR